MNAAFRAESCYKSNDHYQPGSRSCTMHSAGRPGLFDQRFAGTALMSLYHNWGIDLEPNQSGEGQ